MPAPRRSRGERLPESAAGRLAARRAVRCQAAVYGYERCLRPYPHSAARGLGVMLMKPATQLIMAGAGTGIILDTAGGRRGSDYNGTGGSGFRVFLSRNRCTTLDWFTGHDALAM